jgi:hypothetical protein
MRAALSYRKLVKKVPGLQRQRTGPILYEEFEPKTSGGLPMKVHRNIKPVRFFCLGVALVALLAIVGCGYTYLDPGPNPARIVVSVKGTVPEANLPSKGFPVLWDWGLYVVGEGGIWQRLQPTQPVKFGALPGNPLDQNRIFLAPPGKHKLVLSLEAYVLMESGDQTVPVTVAKFGDNWQVDLAPGKEFKIVKKYGHP